MVTPRCMCTQLEQHQLHTRSHTQASNTVHAIPEIPVITEYMQCTLLTNARTYGSNMHCNDVSVPNDIGACDRVTDNRQRSSRFASGGTGYTVDHQARRWCVCNYAIRDGRTTGAGSGIATNVDAFRICW